MEQNARTESVIDDGLFSMCINIDYQYLAF